MGTRIPLPIGDAHTNRLRLNPDFPPSHHHHGPIELMGHGFIYQHVGNMEGEKHIHVLLVPSDRPSKSGKDSMMILTGLSRPP